MHRRLTPEEKERQEANLVRLYLRAQKWLNTRHPVLKARIDKWNHSLFHFMQRHHINLKKQEEVDFKDWRARSVAMFIIAGAIWGIILAFIIMNIILSFSHAFILKTPFPVMLIVLCIGFVPYMLAVQIIETSQYNHQDEIDISKVQPNDKNDSPSKEWKKLSPLRKVETVIGGFFLFLPFFYALFPSTFQTIFLNRYTTAFLPESAIQVMKEFFNLNMGAGFCLLFLAGIVMIRIITIPLRLIFRITSKISLERNTREL